jgi:hypothetical protein
MASPSPEVPDCQGPSPVDLPSTSRRNQRSGPHHRDPCVQTHLVVHTAVPGSLCIDAAVRFQCRTSSPATETLARGEPLLQIWFRPLDLDLAVHNSSLTRIGIARSEPSGSHQIQRSTLPIRPNRYPRIGTRHVSRPNLFWFKLGSNQFQIICNLHNSYLLIYKSKNSK